MSDLLTDLLLWFSRLVSQWQYWLGGGGLGGLALIAVILIERFRGWTMPRLWYVLVFIVFYILGSSFMVWKDEHNKLKELQVKLESPNFIGEIGYTSILSGPTGQPALIVGGLIRNPTGPPSGVINWEMSIERPNGNKILGIVPPAPFKNIEGNIPSSKDAKLVLPADKYWPAISTNPIGTGGALVGWFWSVFPGLNLEDAYEEHALVIIEIRDVIANKPHIFTTKLGIGGSDLPLRIHPLR